MTTLRLPAGSVSVQVGGVLHRNSSSTEISPGDGVPSAICALTMRTFPLPPRGAVARDARGVVAELGAGGGVVAGGGAVTELGAGGGVVAELGAGGGVVAELGARSGLDERAMREISVAVIAVA